MNKPAKESENTGKKRGGCALLFWLALIVLLLGAIVAAVVWNTKRNQLARKLVTEAITKNGTCHVELGPMTINAKGSRIEIGPTLFTNPDVPSDTPMLEIRSLRAEFTPLGLLRGTLDLSNLELHIPQVTLVRQADGSTNADCLGSTLGGLLPNVPKPKNADANDPSPDALPPPTLDVNQDARKRSVSLQRLVLRIDNVSVRDFGRGGSIPLSADVEVNFDETYDHVKSLDDLQERLKADAENIVESLMIY